MFCTMAATTTLTCLSLSSSSHGCDGGHSNSAEDAATRKRKRLVLEPPPSSPPSLASCSPPSNNSSSRDHYRELDAEHYENCSTYFLTVGSRIAVWWGGEDHYYAATITRIRASGDKPYYIVYDDGDREWLNLDEERWLRALSDEPKAETSPKKAKTSTDKAKANKEKDNGDYKKITEKTNLNPLKKRRKKKKRTPLLEGLALPCTDNCKLKVKEEENWVLAGCSSKNDSDSETDEEEIMEWASKMFGVPIPPPLARRKQTATNTEPAHSIDPAMYDNDVYIPISEAVKLGRRRRSVKPILNTCSMTEPTAPDGTPQLKQQPFATNKKFLHESDEEKRRKKEESRPLSASEIKSILALDDDCNDEDDKWVRRSMRQPSRSALQTPQIKALFDKLRNNDTDMVVLKLKKYVSDPCTPQLVMDATLDALEENTNCEALYIQNFNEGMRDAQVLRLLQILQRPSCKIWCLNIGETYKVKMSTWKIFIDGLADTKITHTYASEHTITSELKEQMRSTIRNNRKKHNMHNDPDNLEVIVQCTHCWWNPINAKSLRPYLKKKGYDSMLNDLEKQGLQGSTQKLGLS